MSNLDQVNAIGVAVKIDGKAIANLESYEVTASSFEQPAAFSVRVGWSQTLGKLLSTIKPGQSFELSILPDPGNGGTAVKCMTGLIDSVGVPPDGTSALEIRGRDMLQRLIRSTVKADEAFHSVTYFDLTRKVLDKHGFSGVGLASDNLANRKMWTGVQGVRKGQSRNRTAVLVVEEGGGSGKSKKVYASVKAQVGESWYDFLRRQYKRVGLYLWCAGDGSFVLAAPDVGQPAVAAILRPEDSNAVGMFLPSKTQIVQHDYQLDLSRRHARARVWGRAGDADGRTKVKGQHDDAEAKELGLDPEIDSVDVHDSDVKTAKEAEFAAIRWIAEERRESFRLGYTVSGHTTPSLLGGRAVWAPDTVVDVQDDLLELSNTFYVGSVTFSGPPRTTRLQLHRLQDVWFGD